MKKGVLTQAQLNQAHSMAKALGEAVTYLPPFTPGVFSKLVPKTKSMKTNKEIEINRTVSKSVGMITNDFEFDTAGNALKPGVYECTTTEIRSVRLLRPLPSISLAGNPAPKSRAKKATPAKA